MASIYSQVQKLTEVQKARFREARSAGLDNAEALAWALTKETKAEVFRRSPKPSAKQALLDLYRWATKGPRSGNPYMYEPVKNARRAMGDPRGFDLPPKKPSTVIGKALYELSEWSTGQERAGNPHGRAVVRAANRALGGDGYNLPEEGSDKGSRGRRNERNG